VLLMAGFVATSVVAGRAASIDRLFAMDQAQDMRTRALPTVLGMIGTYFPVGSGFGGFDPIFRINEPFDLLKTTYFNHAHNDFLEIVLDGGLPAALLLAGALAWWGYASFRAVRSTLVAPDDVPPLLGSALLLLLCIASLFDYPARTPMMMAMTIIAAIWLAQPRKEGA
jgi:O-antigen ligase